MTDLEKLKALRDRIDNKIATLERSKFAEYGRVKLEKESNWKISIKRIGAREFWWTAIWSESREETAKGLHELICDLQKMYSFVTALEQEDTHDHL